MDLESRIKNTKETIINLDEQITLKQTRMSELQGLVTQKTAKLTKLAEMNKKEAELLAQLD